MDMLAAYLHGQERDEAHKAFTAQMLWYLNRVEHERIGEKFDHPTWMDMISQKKRDERSGAQIVEEVKAKALSLLEKRKGGK